MFHFATIFIRQISPNPDAQRIFFEIRLKQALADSRRFLCSIQKLRITLHTSEPNFIRLSRFKYSSSRREDVDYF